MSTTTVSRLPTSRIPAKSGKTVNGQQQKTLATPSKLQKVSIKTKLKPTSTGISKKSPNDTSTSTTQLLSPQSTTSTTSTTTTTTTTTATSNTPTAATTKTTLKLRTPIKTNIDSTNKTSPVRSMLPSPKSSISSSSITNDSKSPTKRNLAQTIKQTSLTKRKNEVAPGRNVRAAPSPNIKKPITQTPKPSIITKNIPHKKATPVQIQSKISTKKSTIPARKDGKNTRLLAEIEELRAKNKKLQAENKELMHEKGLLTVDVCQMEHRLACEESRVFELEVDVADLRSLLNGKHNQLDRSSDHYRSELDIANNLIMEQAATMSDQQSLIEELMAQLDEQESKCQKLQNVVDNFKSKHSIDFKDINSFVLKLF